MPNPEPALSLQSALRWTLEEPRAGSFGVIMPIEIAQIDDGKIHRINELRSFDMAQICVKYWN